MNDSINDIPEELLPALRVMILRILECEQLSSEASENLKHTISQIESKLKHNGISLNTHVSQSDMEKAQKYMGGLSGITTNNQSKRSYDNNSNGFDFPTALVGYGIAIMLISSFLSWIGGVISELWAKGIIQIILGVLGTTGIGILIYKLNENGVFDDIKKYLNEKKYERIIKKKEKEKINLVKAKEKRKSESLNICKKEPSDSKTSVKVVKRLVATALAITSFSAGCHIADSEKFNGKSVTFFQMKGTDDRIRQRYVDFDSFSKEEYMLLEMDIIKEKGNKYSFDSSNMRALASNSMSLLTLYNDCGLFLSTPSYYNFEKELSPYLDVYDTELVKLFSDYRNIILYYAFNDEINNYDRALKMFMSDCHKIIYNDKLCELGNPIIQSTHSFSDVSLIAKIAVLTISDILLSTVNDDEYYCIYHDKYFSTEELREHIDNLLSIYEPRIKNKYIENEIIKKYIKMK